MYLFKCRMKVLINWRLYPYPKRYLSKTKLILSRRRVKQQPQKCPLLENKAYSV